MSEKQRSYMPHSHREGTSIWRCRPGQRQAIPRDLVGSWDLHGCTCEQARPQVRQMLGVGEEERAERWVSEHRTGRRQCHGVQTLVAWPLCPLNPSLGYANMTHGHNIGMWQNSGGGRPVLYEDRPHGVSQNCTCGLTSVVLTSTTLGSAALSMAPMISVALDSTVFILVALTSVAPDTRKKHSCGPHHWPHLRSLPSGSSL